MSLSTEKRLSSVSKDPISFISTVENPSSVSVISIPKRPSRALIIFLSVGKLVPASHCFTSLTLTPVKDAICLLFSPLSDLSLLNSLLMSFLTAN